MCGSASPQVEAVVAGEDLCRLSIADMSMNASELFTYLPQLQALGEEAEEEVVDPAWLRLGI